MTNEHSQGARPQLQESADVQPGGSPWVVQVDVYLESDEGSKPTFRIESCLPKDSTKPDDEILEFKNNGRPGFEIHFHLWDLTGKGYRFPKHEDDAVWSTIGATGCPKSEAHEVFTPKRVKEPDGTVLVVENDNPGAADGGPIGKFRYTLNVSTTGVRPYLELDPGGDDQNGPRTFRSM